MSAISQRRGHLPAALTRARVLSRALLLQKSTSSERFPFLLNVPTSVIGCRGGRDKNSGHTGAGKIAKLSGWEAVGTWLGGRAHRAHSVVASHPLRMRKALGLKPSGSTPCQLRLFATNNNLATCQAQARLRRRSPLRKEDNNRGLKPGSHMCKRSVPRTLTRNTQCAPRSLRHARHANSASWANWAYWSNWLRQLTKSN